ncbi:thiamine-phosphate kinase [Vulgatibacter sp.]|uniref:thiamine-phosphate kinase n=1 Tax=Vulgatibacter sp. TaxID=1971226 RepID=UPI00356531C2
MATRKPSEFQLIERFTSAFRLEGRGVVAGPGDDCALTRPKAGHLLVSKVDQVVEGVHFTAAFRPEEIGHKALAVSLSDLAAAGAVPRWFLVAISLRDGIGAGFVERIARGMSRLADQSGVTLVGGNFTGGAQLSIAVTALGEVKPKEALRRSGARPGDRLLVSGVLGEAALGVAKLAGGRPRRLGRSVLAQLVPVPRVALGQVVGRHASAAVDLSDGLLADLGHLCARSGVGATIDRAALPLGPEVAALGPEGALLGLTGGEDYELLLAVPPRQVASLRRAAARVGETLTEIGMLDERPGIRVLDASGRPMALPGSAGWEHFR